MAYMKFEKIDTDYLITLTAERPTPRESQWGVQQEYSITYDSKPYSLTASPGLHKQLSLYGAGSSLNVRKESFGEGKTKFVVVSRGQSSDTLSTPQVSMSSDARTHDIHKQVCLKLAVGLLNREDNSTLSGGELVVIEANMKSLLVVLEGKQEEADGKTEAKSDEDLPF